MMHSIRNFLQEWPSRFGMTGLFLLFLFVLMAPTYGSLIQQQDRQDILLSYRSFQTDTLADNAIDETENAVAKTMVRPDSGTPARTVTKQEHSRVFLRKMQQILLLTLLNFTTDDGLSVKSGIPQGELSIVGEYLTVPLPVRAGPGLSCL